MWMWFIENKTDITEIRSFYEIKTTQTLLKLRFLKFNYHTFMFEEMKKDGRYTSQAKQAHRSTTVLSNHRGHGALTPKIWVGGRQCICSSKSQTPLDGHRLRTRATNTTNEHHQRTKICHIPTSWHVEMLASGIEMWPICCRIVVSLSVGGVRIAGVRSRCPCSGVLL